MSDSDVVVLRSVQIPNPLDCVTAAISEGGDFLIDLRLAVNLPPDWIDRLNVDRVELYAGMHGNLVSLNWLKRLSPRNEAQVRALEALEHLIRGCFEKLPTEEQPFIPLTEVALYEAD